MTCPVLIRDLIKPSRVWPEDKIDKIIPGQYNIITKEQLRWSKGSSPLKRKVMGQRRA